MKYDIIQGDIIDVLKNDTNRYDLIYLDPPFFTQRKHKMSEDSKEISFDDTWTSFEEYMDWLLSVFNLCYEKLTNKGTIYSHNNFKINSILLSRLTEKVQSNFRTNISWVRSHPHNNIKNSYGNIVDSIMMFTRTKNNYFQVQYKPLNEKYLKNSFNNKDKTGNYCLTPITGEKSRLGYFFEYKGYSPKYGWRYDLDTITELDLKKRIHFGKNKPYKKLYDFESKGVPIQNIWDDIYAITRTEKNKRQYPTQKPIELLDRIIKSSCPNGGHVLDPFGGSGTTLIASIDNQIPEYVCIIDKNRDSVDLIKKSVKEKQNTILKFT